MSVMNSMKILPARLAAAWRAVPLTQNDDGSIDVACATPDDVELQDNLEVLLGAPINFLPAAEIEIEKALQDRYGTGAAAIDELSADARPEETATTGTEISDVAMVRFVNDLIRQASLERATDIHIEPFEDDVLIRFRVDGLLHPISLPKELRRFQNLLASRIKVMAQMNIAEKRLPQDGRIRFTSGDHDLDIRVSTIPTIYGETIDLRLLPRQRMMLGLEELGMSDDNRAIMSKLIRKPNGLLLVTGPTGHGKTTTLYACLAQINTADKKIVTIEDPVATLVTLSRVATLIQMVGLTLL
jgi:type II secretory ATPase GspE/PulE/Tfp pilus assembly ATPase PilB-like protein